LSNLLRMGHCAPTIMQTMLDVSETDAQWLVKLTAGLPGGIGNTGGECGGVTAPLVLLGLRHGLAATAWSLRALRNGCRDAVGIREAEPEILVRR
jgi:hypothetical protein